MPYPTTQSLLSTSPTGLVELMTPKAQVSELRRLTAGWLDGEGVSPDPCHLSWLAEQFDDCYPDDAPEPYIYLTPDGNVQLEWTFGAIEAEVVVTLASGAAAWCRTDTDMMASSEKDLDLNKSEHWRWLVAELNLLAAGLPEAG